MASMPKADISLAWGRGRLAADLQLRGTHAR